MHLNLSTIKHPKDGYTIDLNRLIDLTLVFKKRDIENGDRDYCVYVFEDEFGISVYIGMGRGYGNLLSRPFRHRGDLLKKHINQNGTCRIIACGMTSFEAHILESKMIYDNPKPLTKIGAKVGDRSFLINKKQERKGWKYFDEYLY